MIIQTDGSTLLQTVGVTVCLSHSRGRFSAVYFDEYVDDFVRVSDVDGDETTIDADDLLIFRFNMQNRRKKVKLTAKQTAAIKLVPEWAHDVITTLFLQPPKTLKRFEQSCLDILLNDHSLSHRQLTALQRIQRREDALTNRGAV